MNLWRSCYSTDGSAYIGQPLLSNVRPLPSHHLIIRTLTFSPLFDMRKPEKITGAAPGSSFDRLEKLHPHLTLTYLIVVGIFLIFGFLLLAFSHTAIITESGKTWYNLPKAFILSTVAIVASSFTLNRAKHLFHSERFPDSTQQMWLTLGLGSIFCIAQGIGWWLLTQEGAYFAGTGNLNSYLFLLSALHLLHQLVGIGFLLFVALKVNKLRQDPIKALVAATNPYEKIRFQMLEVYWHAMDILWLCIFFVLLFFV